MTCLELLKTHGCWVVAVGGALGGATYWLLFGIEPIDFDSDSSDAQPCPDDSNEPTANR